MNTHAGYSKKTLTDTNVLLTGGGDKSLVDFLGGIQYVSASHKILIKTAAANASWIDLVTLIATDENVKQSPLTNNVNRPLMMINGGIASIELINTSIFSSGIYANTSTNVITAGGFAKTGSDGYHILLGNGGHALLSELSKVANLLKGSYKYTKSNPLTRTATSGDDYSYYTDLNFDAVAGETYVISCETDGNWVSHSGGSYSASAKACGFWLYSTSDTHYSFGPDMPKVWTAPKTANYHIRINMYTNDNPYTLHFWNMKVERGVTATDWLICTDDPWHRALVADSVAWSGITSMPNALGSVTQPVYWNGSGFTLANSYPTKASWNYNDVYVTAVGAGGSGHTNEVYYTKNGSNIYFTVPYASSSYSSDLSYFLASREDITTASGILYVFGQLKTNTSGGKCKAGSYNDESIISFPAGSTGINYRGNTSSESANIGLVRIKWGSGSYMHEFHFSPNDSKFYHRSLLYTTASDWELIPVRVWDGTNVLLGSSTKPVYINASGLFAECNNYPVIPSTYPWSSITDKPVSKTIWGLTYINASGEPLNVNGFLTINCPDWDNDCGIHINEGGNSSYGFDIMYGAGDLFKIATRSGSTTPTNVLTISRGNTNVTVAGSLTATSFSGSLAYTNISGSGTTADMALVSTTTANTLAFKLLGARAFDSTAYLPLSGGTMNNDSKIYWTQYGTSYIGSGIGDGADDTHYNIRIGSWYGVALTNTCPGGDRLAEDVPAWICNVRYGHTTLKGNCTAVNFYTTSDRNKKTNISSFSEHIRKFQLKDTEKYAYGVIALEVEEMFREGEEGNMTVNYNSVLSFYIGQLENKVKILEERIKRLESK